MSAPLSLNVTTRTEALRRVISTTATSAWEFSIWEEWADGEPRICDTDAARRLGYSQARDVRKLIESTWADGQRPKTRAVVRQQAVGRTGTGTRNFTVNEYWLTEAELLKLCARARTDAAEAILDEMIRVFMAVRRHMVETVAVKAHERSFPNAPKSVRPGTLADQPAPCALPPVATRLGHATRIVGGFSEWDVVLPLGGGILDTLRALAAKSGRTIEQQAVMGLLGWSATASSLNLAR